MYENVFGKTPPRFGENAVTLSLDVYINIAVGITFSFLMGMSIVKPDSYKNIHVFSIHIIYYRRCIPCVN